MCIGRVSPGNSTRGLVYTAVVGGVWSHPPVHWDHPQYPCHLDTVIQHTLTHCTASTCTKCCAAAMVHIIYGQIKYSSVYPANAQELNIVRGSFRIPRSPVLSRATEMAQNTSTVTTGGATDDMNKHCEYEYRGGSRV